MPRDLVPARVLGRFFPRERWESYQGLLINFRAGRVITGSLIAANGGGDTRGVGRANRTK